MSSNSRKLIAVIDATGQQGGAVVRGPHAQGQFKVRALTGNPGKHRGLADEVVEADLDRPDTLEAAFEGAHGVFQVTNFWDEVADDRLRSPQPAFAFRKASFIGCHDEYAKVVEGNAVEHISTQTIVCIEK